MDITRTPVSRPLLENNNIDSIEYTRMKTNLRFEDLTSFQHIVACLESVSSHLYAKEIPEHLQ